MTKHRPLLVFCEPFWGEAQMTLAFPADSLFQYLTTFRTPEPLNNEVIPLEPICSTQWLYFHQDVIGNLSETKLTNMKTEVGVRQTRDRETSIRSSFSAAAARGADPGAGGGAHSAEISKHRAACVASAPLETLF